MLTALTVAVIVLAALHGLLYGVARASVVLTAIVAGCIAWWRFADLVAAGLRIGIAPNIAEAAAVPVAMALVLLAGLGMVAMVHRKPRPASRVAGGAVGLVSGAGLVLVAMLATAVHAPGRLDSARAEPVYPPLRTLATVALERTPLGDRLDLAALPPPVIATAEDAPPAPRPIAWTTLGAASVGDTRRFAGTLTAGEGAPLAFEMTGTVTAVLPVSGETVAAGDVIARLDPTALLLERTEREAAVAEARARRVDAQATYDRKRVLVERGVEAQATLDAARAAIGSVAAQVDLAEATLARIVDRLGDAELRAPYAGRIASRLVEPGQVVRAGDPVVTIEDLDAPAKIEIDVPETVVARLAIGQTHRLIDAGRRVRDARLTEIGTRRPGAATFPLILAIADDDGLRAGTTAEVKIALPATAGGVLVPAAAVIADAGSGAHLFLYDPEAGRIASRAVEVLGYEGADARIATDLPPGSIVATRGAAFLADGERVALMGHGVARYEE